MTNEFGIRYNLKKDLILNENFEERILIDVAPPLKIMTLLQIIPKFFTPKLLIEYSIPICSEVSDLNLKDMRIPIYRWEKIEKVVAKEAEKFIKVPMSVEIDLVTHFVGNQIFILLCKTRYPVYILKTILENIVYTWQGTINSKETYLKTLRNGDFSNEVKFYIATKSFMHERILRKYFMRLSEEMILDYMRENPISEEHTPTYFWLCRFTGIVKKIEDTFFQRPDGEFYVVYFARDYTGSPIDFLFLWSLFAHNDLMFQYVWETFTSRTDDRANTFNLILSLEINDFRMANIIIYLLSKISETETEIFINSRKAFIFEYLISQLRWQGTFSKVLNVLHVGFDDKTSIRIFQFMGKLICSRKGKLRRHVLDEFLKKVPDSAKRLLLVVNETLYYKMLQKLYNQGDLESCSLLVEINGPLSEENLFSTNLGTILFDKHIYDLKFKAIDDILKFSWTSLRHTDSIKMKFFRERALQSCHKFLSSLDLESMNLFVNWCLSFSSLRDILLLKSDILVVEDGKLLKELLFKDAKSYDAFQFVDNVLEWCFGSPDFIRHFKNCIIVKETENGEDFPGSNKINVYANVKDCVLKYKSPFIRQLFEWKQCSNEEISELKDSLLNDSEFCKTIFRKKNVTLLKKDALFRKKDVVLRRKDVLELFSLLIVFA